MLFSPNPSQNSVLIVQSLLRRLGWLWSCGAIRISILGRLCCKSRTKYCIFMQITLNNRVAGLPGTSIRISFVLRPPATSRHLRRVRTCRSLSLTLSLYQITCPEYGVAFCSLCLCDMWARAMNAPYSLQIAAAVGNVCSDYVYGGKINIDLHVQYWFPQTPLYPLFICSNYSRFTHWKSPHSPLLHRSNRARAESSVKGLNHI